MVPRAGDVAWVTWSCKFTSTTCCASWLQVRRATSYACHNQWRVTDTMTVEGNARSRSVDGFFGSCTDGWYRGTPSSMVLAQSVKRLNRKESTPVSVSIVHSLSALCCSELWAANLCLFVHLAPFGYPRPPLSTPPSLLRHVSTVLRRPPRLKTRP